MGGSRAAKTKCQTVTKHLQTTSHDVVKAAPLPTSLSTCLCMSKTGILGRRKRSCLQREAEAAQPGPKRQRLHRHRTPSPAHYLDTLSKVWLTKEALQELDRRTRKVDVALRSAAAGEESRRPLTRKLCKELPGKNLSKTTPVGEYLVRCSPGSLKKIRRSARHGGPDLLDLRGLPEQPSRCTMSLAQSRVRKRGKRGSKSTASTAITTTTSSNGAYNPNFEQRMIDNRIYPKGYQYPDGRKPPRPENWEDIQAMLVRQRPSLSPRAFPEERFRDFVDADDQVSSENKAIKNVIPLIQGTIQDERCVEGDVPFYNLADMMRGKSHATKPDVYYGARPEQVPSEIRNDLSAYIVPSTTDTRPVAPSFFLEAKAPGAAARVAMNQMCFAGAVGARGIFSLQTYGAEAPAYDNNAFALSTTYHDGMLKMYAHHIGQPDGPGTPPAHYMSQVKAWALTSDYDTFVQGITAFRNAVDWTDDQRNRAIGRAIAAWNAQRRGDEEDVEDDQPTVADPIHSSTTSENRTSADPNVGTPLRGYSDTSSDELASDSFSVRRPKRSKT